MKKYSCFVISPIGEEGTEIFQEYADLYDLIIVPALEVFDIEVARGDHYVSEERIDASVISKIQNADICICDISVPNPNVYYELGRRDETGKPVILLKKRGSPTSPVDIATRRFIEYDYEGRYAIREAQNHIRTMIEPLIEQGFEKTGRSATLGDLDDTLSRFERKFDKFLESGGASRVSPTPVVDPVQGGSKVDPVDQFKYALRNRNIPMAEAAMKQLEYRMEKIPFYDGVVEQVAAMGSTLAGQMLIDYAESFIFNTSISYKKKSEYLSCLVSYATKRDAELDNLELFETLFEYMLSDATITDAPIESITSVNNQRNRLYYGIYQTTRELKWLEMAIQCIMSAAELSPQNYLYFNATTCYRSFAEATGNIEYYIRAKECIEKCLEMDREDDDDHLVLACRIYHKLQDPKFDEVYSRLQQIAPIRAANLLDDLQ